MKSRTILHLVIFLFALSPLRSAYSEPPVFPVPDHPLLEQFNASDSSPWLSGTTLTNPAHEALSLIESSALHGLEPEDYHYSVLHHLVDSGVSAQTDYFNDLLSDALLDLIHDFAVGRLDPAMVDPDWHIERDSVNPADILHKALIDGQLRNTVNQLLPDLRQYHQLTEALSRYRSFVARGGWHALSMSGLLKPGQSHPMIPALRERLTFEQVGNTDSDHVSSQFYDNDLVQRVKRFQQLRGLNQDGIIGPQTLSALNLSAEQMVDKIRINLERFRWLPNKLAKRYLLINLGSYQLIAMDNQDIALSMKVIVGKKTRSTPTFSSAMTHIVINPYWNVPLKLAKEDLLPKQQANPDYLYLHNFAIYQRGDDSGTEVDPYRVDWRSISPADFPFRLQQRPGRDNALGTLKFMFPNSWDIYLHDTPEKALFDKAQRNFSSGCIRVEQPMALAEFSLNGDVDHDSLAEKIASGQNQGVQLKQPLAVYAVYFTVWPQEGDVYFSDDPYKRDAKFLKYL